MLYYLFEWLDAHYDFPGAGLFRFVSFRAGAAILLSLTISLVFGRYIVRFLRNLQIGETVRDLGLDGQKTKTRNTHHGRHHHHIGHSGSNAVILQIGQYLCSFDAFSNLLDGGRWFFGRLYQGF